MLSGYGAGMLATASAVMGDVLAVARDLRTNTNIRVPAMGCPQSQMHYCTIKPMDQLVTSYYLRFNVKDQPGVLAQIAGILGKYEISIESMIQPHRHAAEAVPIVFMTHVAKERNVAAAVAEINQLDVIQEEALLIRIEENLE
jgi:homoserine dehydrogenase